MPSFWERFLASPWASWWALGSPEVAARVPPPQLRTRNGMALTKLTTFEAKVLQGMRAEGLQVRRILRVYPPYDGFGV